MAERTIEKSGIVVSFNMGAFENDKLQFEKIIKELKANRDMKQSVVDNVNLHHPTVKEIPEFDRHAIHLYQENFSMVKAFNDKLAEIEKQYEEYLAERKEIVAQLPEIDAEVSPLQVVDGEVKAEDTQTNDSKEA